MEITNHKSSCLINEVGIVKHDPRKERRSASEQTIKKRQVVVL
jgi:hypothetical protein